MIPTFAVDVTSLEANKPKGDGSEKENKLEFSMVMISEAMETSELLPLTAILRTFNYFIQKSIADNVQS